MSSKLVYTVAVIRRRLRNVKATISTGWKWELGVADEGHMRGRG